MNFVKSIQITPIKFFMNKSFNIQSICYLQGVKGKIVIIVSNPTKG